MDSKSIVEYIKKKYPKVVFEPVVFQQKKALGFIISDNKLIIGYINSQGIMCKLVEPIDLAQFAKDNITIHDILRSLPIVRGFTETDRANLTNLFGASQKDSLETYKRDCQTTIGQFKSQLDKLTESQLDLQKQTAQLQSENTELQSANTQLQSANAQIQSLNDTILKLERSLADSKPLSEQLETDRVLIDELNKRLELLGNEKSDLEKRVSELQGLNEQLQKDLQVLPETISKREHNQVVKALEKRVNELTSQTELLKTEQQAHQVYYESESNKVVAIKKEYQDRLDKITTEHAALQRDLDQCKDQLVNNKDAIVTAINKYKDEMQEFIKNKDLQITDLKAIHEKNTTERKQLQERLDLLLERERKYLQDAEQFDRYKNLPSDWVDIDKKRQEFTTLQNNIREITENLQVVKNELSKSNMTNELLQGYNTRCKDKILNEKDQIIQSIRDYNKRWNDWSEKIHGDAKRYKLGLLKELRTVQENMRRVLGSQSNNAALSSTTIRRLKQNIADIETELKRTINDQIIQLSAKDEQIAAQNQMLEAQRAQIAQYVQNENAIKDQFSERITDLQSTLESRDSEIQDARRQIAELQTTLKRSLADVDTLLKQNASTQVATAINYTDCYETLQNFVNLNNIFYRKQRVIRILDDIITNNLDTFSKLDPAFRATIQKDFNQVKTEITNHITFLNLSDYVNSPNLGYLKIPATRDRVPESFCNELANLLEYWNNNRVKYREQDRILSNIYEDLAGVARIYVRIKPITSKRSDNESKLSKDIVSIPTINNEKQRSISLDCKGSDRKTYGDFYGVFDETFTNLDVFTGVQPTLSDSLKIDLDKIVDGTGLYHNFRQLQDGYSIVMFGYGNSGSGKTFTLLGSKESPGVLHYGLANLQNVETIRLKYLFEQYYNRINFNNRQISGSIHSLIGRIPQLQEFTKDESADFSKVTPDYIDTNNLRIEDLYVLTGIVDKYRIDRGRIKRTPNNPVSSRSHLYFVFEISFKDGKTGYLTVVDMGGRESPVSIFNTFIDTSVTKLQSVMAPPPVGGVGNIQKTIRPELNTEYTAQGIFDILREGFYTNETLNHLVYYLNLKNGKTIDTPRQPIDERTNVNYQINNYFVQPKDELTKIDAVNNCLTIPILKFLDTISNKRGDRSVWKPTKFILIGCVRQESQYCEQTVETMNLLQNLSY